MVLMPFLFFLAVTIAYPLRQNLSSYLEAKSLESKVEVIQLTLSVVNETQKERGATAGIISGGIEHEQLVKQRRVNDKRISLLLDTIKESTFDDEIRISISKSIQSIKM